MISKYSNSMLKTYFLMDSVLPVSTITALYLFFVLKIGPACMKNREPFKLKTTTQAYNIVQIIVNLCSFLGFFYAQEKYICIMPDKEDHPYYITKHNLIYFYFVIKIFDLFDTVIFVLRKKQSQITFLHVYHHSVVVISFWVGILFVGWGQGFYLMMINSFIHFVMYCYYFLTSYDPAYSKNLWWKKHLTQLQLSQHVIVSFLHLATFFIPGCVHSKAAGVLYGFIFIQSLLMIVLFMNFYIKAYCSKKKTNKIK